MARSLILLTLSMCMFCYYVLYVYQHHRIRVRTQMSSSNTKMHSGQDEQIALSQHADHLEQNEAAGDQLKTDFNVPQRYDVANGQLKTDANVPQRYDVANGQLKTDVDAAQRHDVANGQLKTDVNVQQRHDVANGQLKTDVDAAQRHDVANGQLNPDYNVLQRQDVANGLLKTGVDIPQRHDVANGQLKTGVGIPQRHDVADGYLKANHNSIKHVDYKPRQRNVAVNNFPRADNIKKSVHRRSLGANWNKKPAMAPSDSLPHQIMQELLSNCAHVQVCNSDILVQYNVSNKPNNTCCLQCSCDATCIRTNMCCPDMQLRTEVSFQYIRKSNTQCVFPTKHRQAYEFVSVCLESSSAAEHQKCMQRMPEGGEELPQEETIPVFDKRTLTNYWNIHCAECNRASREDLVMWWQGLSCTIEAAEGVNTCNKGHLPPNEPGINITKCYNEVKEECNVTGQWIEYNQFVEEACHYLHLQYALPSSRYKNIFCALCNGVKAYTVMDGITDCYEHSVPSNVQSPLTNLIQFDVPLVNKGGHLQSKCIPGYKMDPISGDCREVVCSWPRRWDTNKQLCVQTVFFNNARYDIPLAVGHRGNVSLHDITRLRSLLLVDLFQIAPHPLQVCSLEIFAKIDEPFVNVQSKWQIHEFWLQMSIRHLFVLVGVTAIVDDLRTVQEARLNYDTFRKRIQQLGDDRKTAKEGGKCNGVGTTSDMLDSSDIWYEFDTFDGYIFHPRSNVGLPVEFDSDTVPLAHHGLFKGLLYMFESVYDNTTMLDIILEEQFKQCAPGFQKAHGLSFLYCPTFEYGLIDYSISRRPDGIVPRGRDVKFGFDEFRSVNETHVRICVDSVLNKAEFLVSSCMAMRYSIVNVVMAAVVAIVGIHSALHLTI